MNVLFVIKIYLIIIINMYTVCWTSLLYQNESDHSLLSYFITVYLVDQCLTGLNKEMKARGRAIDKVGPNCKYVSSLPFLRHTSFHGFTSFREFSFLSKLIYWHVLGKDVGYRPRSRSIDLT